jgi:hypothetical protein
MEVLETKVAVRNALALARRDGRSVGLVPTMGYLHAGHVSLMDRSIAENDVTLATIFVNPLQFAPGEDLATYPRDLPGDLAKAEAAGVDIVFVPSTEEMYPEPVRTTVSVDLASASMESAARPTHFDGVATVVAKLFGLVGECRAYFGEKDYQPISTCPCRSWDARSCVSPTGSRCRAGTRTSRLRSARSRRGSTRLSRSVRRRSGRASTTPTSCDGSWPNTSTQSPGSGSTTRRWSIP